MAQSRRIVEPNIVYQSNGVGDSGGQTGEAQARSAKRIVRSGPSDLLLRDSRIPLLRFIRHCSYGTALLNKAYQSTLYSALLLRDSPAE